MAELDQALAGPEGAANYQRLIDGGYSQEEANGWRDREAQRMMDKGSTLKEIGDYFGDRHPDFSAIAKHVETGLGALKPEEGKAQYEASGPFDAFAAGLQTSVSGLAIHGAPTTVLPEHAGMFSQILAGTGQFLGDIPAITAGLIGGAAAGSAVGGPIGTLAGAGAGSAALPAAMRQALMDHYASPDGPWTWQGVWGETAKIIAAGGKAGAAGAVGAPLGAMGGKIVGAVAGKVAGAVTDAVGFSLAATAVGGALDGKVPNAQDFTTSTLLAVGMQGFFHAVGATGRIVPTEAGARVTENARDIYAKTGVDPTVLGHVAAVDPVVRGELLAPRSADGTTVTPAIDAMRPREPEPFSGEVSPPTPPEEPPLESESRELAVQGDGGGWEPPVGEPPPPPPPPGEPPSGEGPEPRRLPSGPSTGFIPNANMREDMILDIIHQPGVDKAPLIQRALQPIRSAIAQFQARLTPAKAIDDMVGLDRGQIGVEDMLRQTFASKERAGYFLRYGGLDAITMRPTDAPSWIDAWNAVKYDGGTQKGFKAYRLAARTLEKAKQGIKTGVDLNIATAHLADPAIQAKYERGAQLLARAKDASIDYARESGLWNDARADAIKNLNRFHIIFRRYVDPNYNPSQPGTIFSRTRQPVKKMEGSNREIVDTDLADIDNLHTIVAMADHNRAVGNIIGLIEAKNLMRRDAAGREIAMLRRVDGELGLDLETHRTIDGELQDADGNPIPERAQPALDPFLAERVGRAKMGPDDFIYWRNGKMEIWRAEDPQLAEIMRIQWPGKMNPIASFLTSIASLARAGITGDLSFPFRSLMHGQFASAVMAEEGQAMPFHDVMAGFMHAFGKDDEYRKWVANGGAGAALSDMDRNYVLRDMDKIFNETGTTNAVWNVVRHPLQAMQAMQHMIHAAAGIGAMKRIENQGFSTLKAATLSRTAYLDHAEGASAAWVNTWTKMVPFMSIGIKDLEQFGRAMRDRPITTLGKAAAILTAPSVINFAINAIADQSLPDGQKYTDLPRWERDMYWVLPPINGVRFKIKKPYVAGYMFSTVPERFLEWAVDQNPDAMNGWAKTMADQFVPPFVPSLIMPVAENVANKNFFTGQPLIPSSLEKASGYMQYGPNTSTMAKKIAQVLGPAGVNMLDVSPTVIENYAREWGGTLPMQLLKIMDAPFKGPGKPWEVADIPFAGSFFARHPDASATTIQDFYEHMTEFTQAHENVRLAVQRGDMSLVTQPMEIQAAARLTMFTKALKAYSVVIQQTAKSELTNDEKRKYIDSYTSGMVATARVGITLIEQLKQASKQQ